jgi:hypothetical protein
MNFLAQSVGHRNHHSGLFLELDRALVVRLCFFFGKQLLNYSLGLVIVPFTKVPPSDSSLLI